MSYYLVDRATNTRARENCCDLSFSTSKGASTARTRRIRSGKLDPKFEVMSSDEFYANDKDVEVTNILTGAKVTIKQSQRGGCCDPSTERYHCM